MTIFEGIDQIERLAEKMVPMKDSFNDSLVGIQIIAEMSNCMPEVDPIQEEFFNMRMKPEEYAQKMIECLFKFKQIYKQKQLADKEPF